MIGVDTCVFHGFVNCGATGAITGIGCVLPKEVLHLVALSQAAAKGDAEARSRALELEAALAVLSSFDEGPDLVLYFKHMMVLKGDPEYRCTSTRPTRSPTASAAMSRRSSASSTPGMPNGPSSRRGAQVRRLTA